MVARSGTRVDVLSAKIKVDILAGRQEPGTRLVLAALVSDYGASMGVVREALSRLVAQGLVEVQAQQGFRVAPVSVPDLKELTEARCHVESLVLRQSLEHGSLEWEATVIAAHHRLSRLPSKDPARPDTTEKWTVAHAAFHSALLDGCPNRRLRLVASSLRDSAELYRRWSMPLEHGERDVAAEHAAILAAALSRDTASAAGLLTGHIRHTTRILLTRTAPDESSGEPGEA